MPTDLIERIPEGFTPGPWWVSGKQTIRQGEHLWIAKAFWQATERDVRLIALAPELAAGYRAQAAHIAEMEAALSRIVAEADRNPFNPIGHVIEHVVPEARALTGGDDRAE